MTSTAGGFVHYTQEEIDRLKYEEMQKYERREREGTVMRQEYHYEQQPNRQERRRLKALQRSER